MKLSQAETAERLTTLDNGWTREGDAIRKQYTFKDFVEAIAFVNRLAPEAEKADHHPDILINYKRVTLTYSTHSEGGLTEKDFAGAATADAIEKNV
jgi:4a-hydroxytetrahydrobiopterin dehydratase